MNEIKEIPISNQRGAIFNYPYDVECTNESKEFEFLVEIDEKETNKEN
jgi:hypothetical protein